MTDALVSFLRARLDEDEAAARKVPDPEWRVGETEGYIYTEDAGIILASELGSWVDPAPLMHYVARHDPARVLADVEAKRRVVELHYAFDQNDLRPEGYCKVCSDHGYEWALDGHEAVEHPCETLRLLAQSYAGQEGWQEEWRVD